MIKLDLSTKECYNLTKDETEIAMARKLEFLILPHLRRNINFFYAGANIPKKSEAYNQPISENELTRAVSRESSTLPVVCKPLSIMLSQILRDNGINAEPVSCDTDIFKHMDVLITTTSGKQYIINYLEDMENIQTGMRTPDFASEGYYKLRYEKFEDGITTDGKDISKIAFLSEEQLDKIDENLGYKKYHMYMDEVLEQIRIEFQNFREIMIENEYLEALSFSPDLSEDDAKELKKKITIKYEKRSDEKLLEQKLDWIFKYFNDRMDITGHTDFVMYYSRLLLKKVLAKDEYDKLVRYDCFAYRNRIPEDSIISDVLDYENSENNSKIRFCMIKLRDKAYVFSTKPNAYKKLTALEVEELEKYTVINKSQKPSELLSKLAYKGNGLPLVFHPLGSKMLNERAAMIDPSLSDEEKQKAIDELANSIVSTDGEITSLTIPYPDGKIKYIYINENNEFVVRGRTRETIYHYNEDTDDFEKEIVSGQNR
jgi:hypothetical protein